MEAGAVDVATEQRDRRSTGRPHEHTRDRGGRIAVFPEDVPDTSAVTLAGCTQSLASERLLVVPHGQAGVVLDSGTCPDGAQEVLDLLA